jgi:hypothetical protein
MPRRLLEVVGNGGELCVRLVTNPKQAPYVALSYCWGGPQPAVLTKNRLQAYSASVPLGELPRTIQDALMVTHGIRQRYLWVDALCIVQDSEEDKAREIRHMHNIYRGSLVTIVAATAKTSRDGFIHPRRKYRATKLTVRVDDQTLGEVVAAPDTSFLTRYPAKDTYPIFARAWTFQESRLSTRILAYLEDGLLFLCLKSQHHDGGRDFEGGSRFTTVAIKLDEALNPGNRDTDRSIHPMSWRETLRWYTERELSEPRDKLPALSALAQEYRHTKPVTRYLAGLWEEELLEQCSWEINHGCTTARPEVYRAPSWSWASVDGQIRGMFLKERGRFTCDFVGSPDDTARQGQSLWRGHGRVPPA